MKHLTLCAWAFFLLFPVLANAAVVPDAASAVVFIANYDDENTFLGWGSGFFVDEGIVVTNKHVIEAGDWYRVYATGSDDSVDTGCRKNITKSDVKINLDDDVAYMRVFLPCAHGTLRFADDPWLDDPVWVLGFPYRGSVSKSLSLVSTSGSVTTTSPDGWYGTDALMDFGNSGGPVVNGVGVVGVAVAKGIDADGRYRTGYFVPSSIIESGLLYANDSRFGYTPQSRASVSRSSSSSVSLRSISSVSQAASSSSSSRVSPRSSSRSSRVASDASRSSLRAFPDVPPSLEGYEAIIALRDRGIIAGYPDGRFWPDRGINRAEFIKMLVAGFRADAVRGEVRCFADVSDEWFAPFVCAAKRLGWVSGYPDATFRPSQRVNRAEAMKIIVEVFGGRVRESDRLPSDVRGGTWFERYVAVGVTLGIVDTNVRFRPGDDLTREEAAIWIAGAEG